MDATMPASEHVLGGFGSSRSSPMNGQVLPKQNKSHRRLESQQIFLIATTHLTSHHQNAQVLFTHFLDVFSFFF
jgi:hypothetical protein